MDHVINFLIQEAGEICFSEKHYAFLVECNNL